MTQDSNGCADMSRTLDDMQRDVDRWIQDIGGGYFSDPITQAFMQSPITSVKKEDGSWNFDTVNGYNPVAQRSELGDQSLAKQYRILLSPYIQINFTPDLYFMTRGGADIYLVDEFGYWSFLQPQGSDMKGMGENSNTTRSLLSITNTLNYLKTFNEKHNVNFLLGQEAQYTYLKEAYLAGSNYPVDFLPQVSNTAVPGSASTSIDKVALASFFANAEYDYNNKYYDSILSEFLESKLPILMNNTIDRKSRTISDEDYEILDEELERFREKILVFQYINNEFYTRLDANIIELDEKLITISGKSEYFDRTYEAINKILVKIYKDVEEFLLK